MGLLIGVTAESEFDCALSIADVGSVSAIDILLTVRIDLPEVLCRAFGRRLAAALTVVPYLLFRTLSETGLTRRPP